MCSSNATIYIPFLLLLIITNSHPLRGESGIWQLKRGVFMKNPVSCEILLFYLATNAHSGQRHLSLPQNVVLVHHIKPETPPKEKSISFGVSVRRCEVLRHVHSFLQGFISDPIRKLFSQELIIPIYSSRCDSVIPQHNFICIHYEKKNPPNIQNVH